MVEPTLIWAASLATVAKCKTGVVNSEMIYAVDLSAPTFANHARLARLFQSQLRPVFGPRMNQRITPSTGRTSTRTIQSTFDPVLALLWKMLTIAQMSAIRT